MNRFWAIAYITSHYNKYVDYQRDIKNSLFLYRLMFALLLTGCFLILVFKVYVYLFFLAAAYFIRDFIFPIYIVSISEGFLSARRIFLGGLFVQKFTVERNKILEVTNIDTGVTTDSEINFEFGIFSPGGDSGRKKYELYRIKYLDLRGIEKAIKIPLTSKEVNILNETLYSKTALNDPNGSTLVDGRKLHDK